MADTLPNPVISSSDILAALGLTPDEFSELRDDIIAKRKKAEDTPKVVVLKEPVRFWNDKYRGERVLIGGKRRQFVNGEFTAKNTAELEALRKLGPHVFEGDDLAKPMRCTVCRRQFLNQSAFEDHMGRHVVA